MEDLEIILRPNLEIEQEQNTVGDISTAYFTVLFLHSGNKRLRPLPDRGDTPTGVLSNQERYQLERQKAQKSLALVKALPQVKSSLEKMPDYMNDGYNTSWIRLAHELGNLINPKVVTQVEKNLRMNPNSIQSIGLEISGVQGPPNRLRVISPYFFVARYYDENSNEIFDGVKEVYKWLDANPDTTIELITNSVLTSDNFFAQAVIDMDTAPRLLLSPELLQQWLSGLDKGELNPALVESEAWKKMIHNPRIKIYQTGKIDSVLLGGDKHYGKLHAKCYFADGYGFVGTTNFDYRSRLFNNEFGFFFKDEELYTDLNQVFDELKSKSYLWGTTEWLEMRKKVMEQKGIKASTTRHQRGIYKFLRNTGLKWFI